MKWQEYLPLSSLCRKFAGVNSLGVEVRVYLHSNLQRQALKSVDCSLCPLGAVADSTGRPGESPKPGHCHDPTPDS